MGSWDPQYGSSDYDHGTEEDLGETSPFWGQRYINYDEWKSLYMEGQAVADEFHIGTYMQELMGSDRTPETVLEDIGRLGSRFRGMKIGELVERTGFEYALKENLHIPLMNGPSAYEYSMALTDILTPPISDMTLEQATVLTGYLPYGIRSPMELPQEDRDRITRLYNSGIKAIDDYLRRTTDRGLLEMYGGGPAKRLYCARGGKHLTVKYVEIRDREGLSTFFRGLLMFCMKHLGYTATVSSFFRKEYRDIVRGTSPGPVFWEKGGKGTVSRPYREGDFDGPAYFEDYISETGPSLSKGDFERYYHNEHGPCPYVPSKVRRAGYTDLTDEQLDYYFYWRSEVRKGRYRDTDRGYMWLYLSELVNTALDPRTVKGVLNGINKNYGPFEHKDDLIRSTTLQFLLLNGFPLTRPDDRTVKGSLEMYIEQYIDGAVTAPISPETVNDLVAYARIPYFSMTVDEDSAGIMDLYLGNVLETIRQNGKDPLRTLGGRYGTRSVRVEYDRIYAPDIDPGYIKTRPFYRSGEFVAALQAWAYTVPSLIKEYRRTGKIKRSARKVTEYEGMVSDCTETWFSEKEDYARIRRISDISLDDEAIMVAENDLEDVTRMISSAEDEEVWEPEDIPDIGDMPTAEDRTPPSADDMGQDSPWTMFISSLSTEQRSYLRRSMEGTRPDHRMEDSINSVAMDTVGDIVVEGGDVVEDYLEDIGKVLE